MVRAPREISLSPYRISKHAVTNRQFEAYVQSTGYTTEAERFEWSFVFHLFLPDDFPDTRGVAATPWWRQVYGADWAHPAGPQSGLDDVWDHPVIHVSWNDAQAYCQWAGVRLPTEAEWEMAARGDLVQQRLVWGDEFSPNGVTMCNIFEGDFPITNTADDGYVGTAPVDAFRAKGFGLHNMAGNVWKWCSDWFHTDFHINGPPSNPQGPRGGEAKGHTRRLVPLPRFVSQSLPGLGSQLKHPRLGNRQSRLSDRGRTVGRLIRPIPPRRGAVRSQKSQRSLIAPQAMCHRE